MKPVKTAAVIHDLSGVGRCALTVVLPVLSAMGIQACPVPTAVLSTHTGGFDNMASVDLTDLMGDYLAHWRSLGLRFDAVYSGYLANCAQADHVMRLMRENGGLNVVDPVMGDEGEIYSALPEAIVEEMRRLCSGADVITPNLTEAALLLGESYTEAPRTDGQIEYMLRGLSKLGAKRVVLTGVPKADGRMANAYMTQGDRMHGEIAFERLGVQYPGTGDLFASVLTGAMVQGAELSKAVERAAEFVYRAIEVTIPVKTEPRMGVQFEKILHVLACDAAQNGSK